MRLQIGTPPGIAGRGRRAGRPAFTLVEILIVVVIIGILAALVFPSLTGTGRQARETSARRHLQILRHQIEYYRVRTLDDPDLIDGQWDDLLLYDFIQRIPINPLNGSTFIAGAANPGVGWIWRDNGYGVHQLYATDDQFVEFVE